MISTVTTATVTTVTTATIAVLGSLSLLAIVMLLGMMISKELVSVSDRPRLKAFGSTLNVAIVPLLLAFVLVVVVKVAEVLR
jgi:hypothetical protein